ncbi:L-threonylcarbamoyladenylate synthase [[Mycoplasma] gypis]|uniref:L-threonylcarbamoyladenylate synthase n=1 Tax=[Mycoplasma] gypis TaxID=92404 RepID=A0ABZ2RNZ7_9BACT|nr:Sua5/YciO/YrdC/YwlC family protein [[Mycoplasma] gypis]MBN0919105.1 Sua5/YciO/YrdC/YwlC family protein [[Mycoplasma] gypis]
MSSKYDDVFVCTTDTVLGLGTSIKSNSLHLLYELKKRDISKKIIILVSSLQQAQEITNWDDKAIEYAKKYWPGAVSLIVNGQGFRMPNQQGLLQFLEKEGPCFVTSCNISDHETAKSIKEAKEIFPQIKRFYDFGPMSQKASKIIDVNSGKIIRE